MLTASLDTVVLIQYHPKTLWLCENVQVTSYNAHYKHNYTLYKMSVSKSGKHTKIFT